jgi:hypothetical protein
MKHKPAERQRVVVAAAASDLPGGQVLRRERVAVAVAVAVTKRALRGAFGR